MIYFLTKIPSDLLKYHVTAVSGWYDARKSQRPPPFEHHSRYLILAAISLYVHNPWRE